MLGERRGGKSNTAKDTSPRNSHCRASEMEGMGVGLSSGEGQHLVVGALVERSSRILEGRWVKTEHCSTEVQAPERGLSSVPWIIWAKAQGSGVHCGHPASSKNDFPGKEPRKCTPVPNIR